MATHRIGRGRNSKSDSPIETATSKDAKLIVEISSIADLLSFIQGKFEPCKETVWYRGHCNASWTLTPSLYRKPYKLAHESSLITRFQQNALPLCGHRPISSWEWLFLMRHHGCPTRLLDWTESPLVALYFACELGGKADRSDGDLWCLRPTKFNETWGMMGSHAGQIPSFGVGTHLDEYSPEKVNSAPGLQRPPAAAIAPREAGRMTVQQSVFTIHHVKVKAIETYEGDHLTRLRIPLAKKDAIRRQLAALGVNRLSIYPELDSVARVANESVQ